MAETGWGRLTALAMLAGGMIVFGSATPVSKLVGDDLPVFVGAFLRIAVGALVILPFALKNHREISGLGFADWLRLSLIALFGMFGFSVLMLYGMRIVPGVVGSVVMSTTPAVTAAGAILFFGERLDWRKAAAIVLAVAGVFLVNLNKPSGFEGAAAALVFGSALVFAAVCCEAAYTLIGKVAVRALSPISVTFWAAALSLPLFLPMAAGEVGSVDWTGIGWRTWLAVAWWGAGTLALGSLLWYGGVSRVDGTTAAGFMGLMPVSALVLSYVLLGEPVEWLHLAGFAVVFIGVLLVIDAHRRGTHDPS